MPPNNEAGRKVSKNINDLIVTLLSLPFRECTILEEDSSRVLLEMSLKQSTSQGIKSQVSKIWTDINGHTSVLVLMRLRQENQSIETNFCFILLSKLV